jgi:hypothetical protein
MPQRTKFLSKLIGLYCVLVALSMFAHKEANVEMMRELMHSPPLVYVVGLMAVVAGLAMVLGHNVWSGGAVPMIVTVIGWAALIKGALLLFLSPAAAADVFLGGYHYAELFYFYAAGSLLIGTYLTYAGTKSTAR